MNKPLETTPSPAQAALKRLVFILLIAVGVIIYAYGWEVTDISLAPTQEATRQDSVSRAMQELLSPNIFTQPSRIQTFRTPFIMDCEAGEAEAFDDGEVSILLSPACGNARDVVIVEAFGFPPSTDTDLFWVPEEGQLRPIGSALTDATGSLTTEITVPNIRGVPSGAVATVAIRATIPDGVPQLSSTTHLVIEKMIETIFLALMATTLALPIAVVLSFLAAHNLMKPIKMPIGKALIGLAMFPVGWMIGQTLLAPVADAVTSFAQGDFTMLAGIGLFAFASVGATQTVNKFKRKQEPPASFVRANLMSLGVTVGFVLALGFVGGLAIMLGNWLKQTDVLVLGYLGNFINTLGSLIEITIATVSAFLIGVYVSGLGMRLSTPFIRSLSPVQNHIAGVVLGAIGGALIMMLSATIGSQAALMTFLLPLFAGLLGAQIPVMAYDRTLGNTNPLYRTQRDRAMRPLLRLAGFGIVFVITFLFFDVSRSIVQGRLPVYDVILMQGALVGALLGGVTAGMTGVSASMPMGTLIYNITRTTLNALRSIEPLIMGIVFVIWVGIGPFAGVLALTLHSIASLGKLYSEQIENIDEGPIEALLSTGANRVQTILYAVVPQIVPPYIAFTLYRWDINVRMSTIIGFVGGGGVGFLLQQQINLLRYREAGVAVLAIAIVVSVLDYASASIRERIM